MVEIGVSEAASNLSVLLEQVEQGEQVLITRDGKPVVQMSRVLQTYERTWTEDDQKRSDEAYARIRERANQLKMGPFDWEEYKKWRDEGRP